MPYKTETVFTPLYEHIDNGGISIEFETKIVTEDETTKWADTKITMNCQYFGYPDVESTINLGSHLDLRKLMDTLTEHYDKIQAKL